MASAAPSTDVRALEERCVDTIRTLSMDAVQRANSGHPGTPMALAPLAHVLFSRVMRHDPAKPDWPGRDRFVLSAGHASMLLYSMLFLCGYGLRLEDLQRFRQLESPTAGHPERKYAAGIETTTGPLGQGIATAVGLALGERMLAARFNLDGGSLVDNHTFVIASDGDMQEGISGEASSLAGHLGLGRLVCFYDDNHISIEGNTELSFSEDVGKRYEAYGWHVQDLGEETDLDALEDAARTAMDEEDRPSLVIVRTHIAPGSPNKQDTGAAHGSPLGKEEVRLTKEAYGWPAEPPFFVPEEVLEHYRAVGERGAELEREWNDRAAAYREAHPEEWRAFESVGEGRLPEGWDADPPRFEWRDESGDERSSMATRKASEQVIQWAAAHVPTFVGGSADLAPSTNTLIAGGGDVERGSYAGRNLHFGIREHAMGAVVNGLNLAGLRAFGATFLVFSDYMRGSIRLAALMKLPSIFVFTHDSIGVGEDGPTHQPVEHLAGLRAVPRLCVLRPADANETALCWRFALRQADRPSAFALSRQSLPVLDPEAIPDDAVDRGAYVLREASGDGAPDLVLMGTGAEVHVCLDAATLLEAEGIRARVVSMPCVDRFAEQDDGYRDSVLPPGCPARVAVEAASPLGWDRFVGDHGEVHAMETFGESGPAGALFTHFGFTPERVAERARSVLRSASSYSARA